ncbi:hypothetical protein [Streptomyces sp. SP18CS02]|uniref:hypothetical protein n=1 Tax=Streptomyces sp. SP18CS02 TaxID=3002531 RepID=UPI002E77493D|nr:hypothetical protein [Streptomyces sp. SP18CS02]MEE1752988.1 hypothetical protein [Streptomyces sp. SP18CS02]
MTVHRARRLLVLLALPAALALTAVTAAPAAAGADAYGAGSHRLQGSGGGHRLVERVDSAALVPGGPDARGRLSREPVITLSHDAADRAPGAGAVPASGAGTGGTQGGEVPGVLVGAGGIAFVLVAGALALGRRRDPAVPACPAADPVDGNSG